MACTTNLEPRRIRALRIELARAVPRFPNNRETLKILNEKSLGEILIDYLNWAKRFVTPRKREVLIAQDVFSDPRLETYRDEIELILGKVQRGEDLNPYLSTKIRKRGYSPNAGTVSTDADRWCDKDFLLNVMGLYHLHLDAMPHDKKRSDEMLFAEITKTTFTLVGIFNHEVFEPALCWSIEKQRLWQVFENRSMNGALPGAVLMTAPIATSGHSIETIYLAMGHAKKIAAMDSKIDDRAFVEKLYGDAEQQVPKKPKLKWAPWFQEIGIYDASTRGFFSVCAGWN